MYPEDVRYDYSGSLSPNNYKPFEQTFIAHTMAAIKGWFQLPRGCHWDAIVTRACYALCEYIMNWRKHYSDTLLCRMQFSLEDQLNILNEDPAQNE